MLQLSKISLQVVGEYILGYPVCVKSRVNTYNGQLNCDTLLHVKEPIHDQFYCQFFHTVIDRVWPVLMQKSFIKLLISIILSQ